MIPNALGNEEAPAHFWTFDGCPGMLQHHRAEFPGSRDSLNKIREMAEAAATSTPLDEAGVAEVEMAVDEIGANIVEHGYEKSGRQGTATLRIEIALFVDRLEIIVTDESAIRFAVDKAPARGFAAFYEEQRERGLGLDIVRHCVDKVDHQWLHPQGNQTRLIKFFATGQDG